MRLEDQFPTLGISHSSSVQNTPVKKGITCYASRGLELRKEYLKPGLKRAIEDLLWQRIEAKILFEKKYD